MATIDDTKFDVNIGTMDGKVIISFNKLISNMKLGVSEAETFANVILQKVTILKGGTQ
jgi:hypothetical protein